MRKQIQTGHRVGVTCGVALTALALNACAPTSDGQLAQAQGAGIGAVGGGVLGAIIGNNTKIGTGGGALIGATAGGLAGYAYGTHVANQKAKYKSTEQWLDACIADAEKKRQAAVAYNHAMDSRLAQLRVKVRDAKAGGNQDELKKLKQQILAEHSKAEEQMAAVNKEIQVQQVAVKDCGNSSRTVELRTKLSDLNSANASTKKNAQSLAQLGTSTGV